MSQSPVAVKPQASGLPGLEDTASRISRIEVGLLPAAVIQGQSLPRMLLTDRMKHYDVPGVSIAVFDYGQILWTRGYGLADISANDDPGSKDTVASKHHDKPLYILAGTKNPGKSIRRAPFINHTDQELALIETLVGRTPAFVFTDDRYGGPQRDPYKR